MKKTLRLAALVLAADAVLGLTGCLVRVEEHEHTFATPWISDATHHWHAATCEHKDEVDGKAEHTYGEWSEAKRVCSVCDYEQTCTHTFEAETVTVQPTEEAEGELERTCKVCGTTEKVPLAKLDHVHAKGMFHQAVASTCVTNGTVAYYECAKSTCLVKLDKDGNPLATIEAELDPANHEGTTTWTKTAATHKETYDCCDAVKTSEAAHTWNEGVVTKPSTEEAEGVKTFTCSVCKMTKTEAIAKLPHTHKYASSWTSDGSYHWHASTCGHPSEVSDKALHTWNAGVVTKSASISGEGIKTCTCTACQMTKTEKINAFGWCETPIDTETGLAATASSKYIYFGVFPRTVLPSDSTVTVDENDKVEMGANTYYKGSDGEYYAKALENAYGTGAEYKYKNGEQSKQKDADSYRYFKVEPIKWKVLATTYDIDGEAGSATGALLLAEDILTANVPYYEDYKNNRTIDGKTVYPNNYKYSQIRAYLNGLTYQGQSGEVAKWNGKGFLQAAFTESAQSKIVTTTVDNSGASTTDATGYLTEADGSNSSFPTDYTCGTTSDKIFLLSEREVTTTAYGFAAYSSSGTGNARIRKPTDYAKANYAYQDSTTGYGGCWWLRSPNYYSSNGARYVDDGGNANYYHSVYYPNYGVVPALSISF